MGKERIGIMGGTLDPVHDGHLLMARCALSEARLDRVLMLPSGTPPHKPHVTPAEDRWRMLVAACAGMLFGRILGRGGHASACRRGDALRRGRYRGRVRRGSAAQKEQKLRRIRLYGQVYFDL